MPGFVFRSFRPDANPMEEGAVLDCQGFYPNNQGGMSTVPGTVVMSDAAPEPVLAASCTFDLDGNIRMVAGTTSKLLELVNSVWQDKSKSGGYSGASDWCFLQWGNWLLATDYIHPIQYSAGGVFADLPGSPPSAKYITAASNFVVLGAVNDGSEHPQRVHWSALGDCTDWTPSLATQAGYVDLQDTPGPITGLASFAENLVVFKEAAVYIGTYIGPPLVWNFKLIMADSGAVGTHAHVLTEQGLYFLGTDDIYLFNGAGVTRIGAGVINWLKRRMHQTYRHSSIMLYDHRRRLIYLWYVSVDGANDYPDDCLILNHDTGSWGRMSVNSRAAVHYVKFSITYGTISSYVATYADFTLTYGDVYWSGQSYGAAYIDKDNYLRQFDDNAPGGPAYLTSNLAGTMTTVTRVRGAKVWFTGEPVSADLYVLTRSHLGESPLEYGPYPVLGGKVDFMVSGRLASVRLAATGPCSVNMVEMLAADKGLR